MHARHDTRLGCRRILQETIQHQLHPEVIRGTPEEHRRRLAIQNRLHIEFLTGDVQHLQLLTHLCVSLLIQARLDLRVRDVAHAHRSTESSTDRALEEMHLLRMPVIHALEITQGTDRPVHRERSQPQHLLQLIQQLQRLDHRPVTFVHECEDRHSTLRADLEQLACLGLDTLRGIDHHDHRIHCRQHAICILGEIFMPGRIQQIDAKPVVVELQHSGTHGDTTLPLQFHPVRSRRALALPRRHGPRQLHGATIEQQLFSQRRLTGIRMRDDRKRPALGNFIN